MSAVKKIAVMQPYFFPYLGYFQLASHVDHFVFFDDVNFIKKGWINRNNILGNEVSMQFTIPLKKASQNRKINEIYIAVDEKWKVNFFNTIHHQYKNAPFYDNVLELLKEVISVSSEDWLISDLAIKSVSSVFNYLGLSFSYSKSSDLEINSLKGQSRIIAICKHYKAATYINPINGKNLYDERGFALEGLQLKFIEMINIEYKQSAGLDFIPFLSIIDCLMFLPKKEVVNRLSNFKLV